MKARVERPEVHRVEVQLAGSKVTFETGRIARQADAAVVARAGETVVLATVVAAREPRPGGSFFPLTVDYREKLAAAGRIPGSYNRREGRISDGEVLMCRLVDRTVRSLFPKAYRCEVQIQVLVLSADPVMDVTSVALLAATAALHVSPLPAKGPAAGLRIVRVGDGFQGFPSREKQGQAGLDFVVSAGPDGLVMVEGEAREASEDDCVAALEQALAWLGKLRVAFEELGKKAGKEKLPVPPEPELPAVPQEVGDALAKVLGEVRGKAERAQAVREVRDRYLEGLGEIDEAEAALARDAIEELHHQLVRERILGEQKRPDGRGPADIRGIWSEVGLLPRTHGSAIFTRGETQALATCTLGTPEDAQRLENLAGRHEDPFILHYNFPPYCVNEVRPLRGPGRREIGHANLARRGLHSLLPDKDEFPYTIRIESEITESNGSSSMATVCAGSLALFHAGVPMQRAAAGIAMGLVTDGKRTVVLSDIVGEEDHLGDMDFKVVGTKRGITALQLDNKVGGLSLEQLTDALRQASAGRTHILEQMAGTLAAPSAEMPRHAPRVQRTAIMPDSIGLLVGPRGANIKEIQATTGARVSIDDHGVVLVYAADGPTAESALRRIHRQVGVVKAGSYYNGTVTGVKDFGAFVRINAVTEGLVPNVELEGAVEEGSAVVVKVLGADDRGRLRLSHKQAVSVDTALIEF
ncbi:MAG: polyribonucleotide nucleotidyltransferase [Planctomycetota bacterium]